MFTTISRNKLPSFKTIINKEGLIALKTKIFNRVDDYYFRCPILLESNHEVIYLLVREKHELMGHAETQIL